MKFVEPSHFTDPDAAARKLVQIANAVEAVHDGRIFIELINGPFLKEGGTPDQFRAPRARDHVGLAGAAQFRHLCEVHPVRCRAVRLKSSGGRMQPTCAILNFTG
jgi:hypothetical protein